MADNQNPNASSNRNPVKEELDVRWDTFADKSRELTQKLASHDFQNSRQLSIRLLCRGDQLQLHFTNGKFPPKEQPPKQPANTTVDRYVETDPLPVPITRLAPLSVQFHPDGHRENCQEIIIQQSNGLVAKN